MLRHLRQNLSKQLLRCIGWRPLIPSHRPPKTVICVAPHTSNRDFFMGKLYYGALSGKAYFLMKKEWFFFPLGYLLRWMGGIPIDRDKKGSVVDRIAARFRKASQLHIAITPEGTRAAKKNWKTGFYYIAKKADIPIELAKIDYKKKEIGIFELFHTGDDQEKDLAYIRSRYTPEMAYRPSGYIPSS